MYSRYSGPNVLIMLKCGIFTRRTDGVKMFVDLSSFSFTVAS